MAEVIGKALLEPKECSNDELASVCMFCATDESSTECIDGLKDISSAIKNLLELALEGRADDDEDKEVDGRRCRLAICTLINTCNRSLKLRKTVKPEIVNLCRAVLRIDEIRVEFCHFLLCIISHLNEACALNKDYPKLLSEVALLWESMEDNSAITGLFVSLLEHDYAFLAHSFADFPTDAFTALMRITETILDSVETEVFFNVHGNNVLFCSDLIGRIFYDLGEGKSEKTKDYVEQLLYATESIAHCALRTDDYADELLKKPATVLHVVDILDTALDCQAVVDQAEAATSTPRPQYPDRPDRPVDSRMPRVEQDKGMAALSAALLNLPKYRALLKQSAVRAIGNLCAKSRVNQLAAGERGAVISALRSTKKHADDQPFISQWAITCLRFMLLNCPENQDVIANIDQKPTGIIDREKLFKELGVEVVLDEATGKMKVTRVSSE